MGHLGMEEGILEEVTPNMRPEGWIGASQEKRERGHKPLRFLGWKKREGPQVSEDLKTQ